MQHFNEIEKLWDEFYETPFPAGLAGEEIQGICVMSLDTFTAGCLDTFVSRKGRLDKKRKSILIECRKELETVVKNLDGEARLYYERLLILSEKTLRFLEFE